MVRRSERCFGLRNRKIKSNEHDSIIIDDADVYLILTVVRCYLVKFHMYITFSIGTHNHNQQRVARKNNTINVCIT